MLANSSHQYQDNKLFYTRQTTTNIVDCTNGLFDTQCRSSLFSKYGSVQLVLADEQLQAYDGEFHA